MASHFRFVAVLVALLLWASTDWALSERSINRPASEQTHFERGVRNTDHLTPVGKGHGSITPRVELRPASVSVLDEPRGPSTICGFVVPIIVNAVNGVPRRWAHTHVVSEGCERLSPSLADGDTASTPIRIANHSRVSAALNHFGPAPIFGGSESAVVFKHSQDSNTFAAFQGEIHWL